MDTGLWASIEKDFEEWGMKDKYNKKFVKAAVYSSLFSGGQSAMIEKNQMKLEKKLDKLGLNGKKTH